MIIMVLFFANQYFQSAIQILLEVKYETKFWNKFS